MINQSNLKGKALADTILSHLKSLNLLLEKMIGQGYDGASSMSGKEKKDVQVIVKESCPLAVYAHCSAHVLNLVLVNLVQYVKFIAHLILKWILVFLNQAVEEVHD